MVSKHVLPSTGYGIQACTSDWLKTNETSHVLTVTNSNLFHISIKQNSKDSTCRQILPDDKRIMYSTTSLANVHHSRTRFATAMTGSATTEGLTFSAVAPGQAGL